jgi:hypothetical protein
MFVTNAKTLGLAVVQLVGLKLHVFEERYRPC